MAGADRIHTSGLHDLQLALRGAPVDGSAKSAEIMMQADTMQLAALAIQQKTSVLVECDGANPECSGVLVDDPILVQDLSDEGVQIRTIHVPALWPGDAEVRANGSATSGGYCSDFTVGLRNRLPGLV